MKTLINTILFFTFSLFVLACTPEHSEPLSQTNNQEEGKDITTLLSFEDIKAQVFKPHCIDCHSGRHTAYENYQVVKSSLPAIMGRITSQNAQIMPPRQFGKPLSATQMALVQEWMDAGAPEFANIDAGIDDDNTDDDIKEPDPQFISFQDVSDRILTPKCVGCHSHYENYDVVKKQLGSIFGLVMADKMPYAKLPNRPPVPLDEDSKKLLSDWVNQGAPYTELQPDGPQTDTSLKPTWLSLRDNIFGPKCILCHNSFGPRGPTKMTNYRELLAWSQKDEKLFNFEDPEKSRFIGSMIGRIDPENNEFFFDPMPFNVTVDDVPTDLAPVSEAELEVIKEWIKNGLPYD